MSKTTTFAAVFDLVDDDKSHSGPYSLGPYTFANSPGQVITYVDFDPGELTQYIASVASPSASYFAIIPNASTAGMAPKIKAPPPSGGSTYIKLSDTNPSFIPLAGGSTKTVDVNVSVPGLLPIAWF